MNTAVRYPKEMFRLKADATNTNINQYDLIATQVCVQFVVRQTVGGVLMNLLMIYKINFIGLNLGVPVYLWVIRDRSLTGTGIPKDLD